MKKASIDVTYNELKDLGNHPSLKNLFQDLYRYWVNPHPERADNVRIGTVDVYLNEDGNLKIEFTTRFSLNEN